MVGLFDELGRFGCGVAGPPVVGPIHPRRGPELRRHLAAAADGGRGFDLSLKALIARAGDWANPGVDHLAAVPQRFELRLDGLIAIAMAAYGQQDGKKNGTFAHPSPRKRRCEIMLRTGGTMQAETWRGYGLE